MLVAALAIACNMPPTGKVWPIADPTLNDSPAARARADRMQFDALGVPAPGTRYTVAVTALAVVLVSVQAEIVVSVLAGTV